MEIKLYKSPIKSLRLFILSSVLVLPCSWFIFIKKQNDIIFWICLCFFSVGYFISIFHFFDRRPQIIINKNGIWDRTTRQGLILWEHIEGAYEVNIVSQKFISLVMNENFKFKIEIYQWAKKINAELEAQDLNLNVSQLRINVEKLITLINILKNEKVENREQVIEIYKNKI